MEQRLIEEAFYRIYKVTMEFGLGSRGSRFIGKRVAYEKYVGKNNVASVFYMKARGAPCGSPFGPTSHPTRDLHHRTCGLCNTNPDDLASQVKA